MKVYIDLYLISLNHIGKSAHKLFWVDWPKDPKIPSVELSDSNSIESSLNELITKCFGQYDPKWMLRYLTLSSVFKDSDLHLVYTCLVPELDSDIGKFVEINDFVKFKEIIQSIRKLNV